jgi:hypothetical protein
VLVRASRKPLTLVFSSSIALSTALVPNTHSPLAGCGIRRKEAPRGGSG